MSKLNAGDRISWAVFQKLFARKQQLPYGTEFELVHRKSATGAERLARSTQKKVTLGKFQGLAANAETLNDLIWNRLTPSLTNPPSREKFNIRVKGPNGERPKGGNLSVGKMREWTGQPTPAEIKAQIEFEAQIEDVCQAFGLSELHYGRDPEALSRGVMRKLLTQFSAEDLQLALAEEIEK